MTRFALGCALLLLLPACDDDESGSGSETTATTAGATTTGTPDTTGSTGAVDPTTSTTAAAESSSSGSADDSSSGGGGSTGSDADASTGNPNACNPQVPGEFNACIGDNGNVDNTLCNWMGIGGAQGFIGCLTSSETEGANVCMISDCVEACDCFAQPDTGTAQVECAEVLEGGGTACVLNCANGETCPDGMSCEGGLCFHLPAK